MRIRTLRSGYFLKVFTACIFLLVGTDINRSTAGIDDDDTFATLEINKEMSYQWIAIEAPAHLNGFIGQSFLNAEMQACFSFANENQSRMARRCVRNKARCCGCLAHQALLRPFPPVGVREHEVRSPLEASPHGSTIWIRLLDVSSSTFIEVLQKVGEDIDSGLPFWQGNNFIGHVPRRVGFRT